MPYLDPAKRKEASRRYYASKGRAQRAKRYRESLGQTANINYAPLAKAINNWTSK